MLLWITNLGMGGSPADAPADEDTPRRGLLVNVGRLMGFR